MIANFGRTQNSRVAPCPRTHVVVHHVLTEITFYKFLRLDLDVPFVAFLQTTTSRPRVSAGAMNDARIPKASQTVPWVATAAVL